MEKYVSPTPGETITFEPYNFDGMGLAIAPGQRCRVTITYQNKAPVVFEVDRHLAKEIIGFLDRQK